MYLGPERITINKEEHVRFTNNWAFHVLFNLILIINTVAKKMISIN